jgi:hypothetical protein
LSTQPDSEQVMMSFTAASAVLSRFRRSSTSGVSPFRDPTPKDLSGFQQHSRIPQSPACNAGVSTDSRRRIPTRPQLHQ